MRKTPKNLASVVAEFLAAVVTLLTLVVQLATLVVRLMLAAGDLAMRHVLKNRVAPETTELPHRRSVEYLSPQPTVRQSAYSGLVNLGYKPKDVRQFLAGRGDSSTSVEDFIRDGLRALS